MKSLAAKKTLSAKGAKHANGSPKSPFTQAHKGKATPAKQVGNDGAGIGKKPKLKGQK